MRIFLILLLALTFAAHPASAADIFNKPHKDALPEVPAADQPSPAPTAVPDTAQSPPVMAPTAPPSMAAGTETVADFADRYTKNCLAKQNEILKGDDLRMLCACTASKLQEKMTVDQVRQMMTDTPEGQVQRNRMAIEVYAPCMEYPSHALLMSRCNEYQDSLKKTQGGQTMNGDQICSCLAQNMAAYTAMNAPAILAKQLAVNPKDTEPLAAFLNSQEYQAQINSTFTACVQQNGVFKQQ